MPTTKMLCSAACLWLIACTPSCGKPEVTVPTQSPPPAAPMGETQSSFEEQRRKIEAERRRQAELEQRRRSFIGVKFAGFDDDGRVRVTMSNLTDKDIDDVRGGIQAETAEGEYLASSGYTEAVPNDLFLAAGASLELRPFISPKPKLVQALRDDANAVVFSFSARAITYGDGGQESGLDD